MNILHKNSFYHQAAFVVLALALFVPNSIGAQPTGIFKDSFEDLIIPDPPTINSVNPLETHAGELVTINGLAFLSENGHTPVVALSHLDGGTINAPVSAFADTSITITVPTGASTGTVKVTTQHGFDDSADELVILPSSDFALLADPGAVELIRGEKVAVAVSISSDNGFALLALLQVSGLPAGVSATISPPQVAADQIALLEFEAPMDQATGATAVTVSASSTVDGIPVTDQQLVTLNVVERTTSFRGRTVVADPEQTPLAGVTVTMLGVDGNGKATGCTGETVSDAAGNFSLTDLPEACEGGQLIRYDGTTATNPPGEYAGVDLFYDIQGDTVTESPVLIHLPRIDDKETWMVIQNHFEDQTFQSQTIPNLSVIVYAGTILTLKDGSTPDPFPLTVIQVPVDRLPDEMPPNDQTVEPFIVAFQPANATASQPVAVFFPNPLNTAPGTQMPLITLDPTQGMMVDYGTGTVSADGTHIIPDFDPAFPGHRYGLVHFDWHGNGPPPVSPPPPPPISPPCTGFSCGEVSGNGPETIVSNPIDLSSGLIIENDTDIAFGGPRGFIRLTRNYRTLSNTQGPFGIGTGHNYGYRLNTNTPQTRQLINLILPNGRQVPFARQPDGSFINGNSPATAGATLTVAGDGEATLKWKNGTTQHFTPSTFPLGSILTWMADANGNNITLTRDPSQPVQIIEIIDAVGRKLLLEYDGADRITKLTDPIGRTVLYSYNGMGSLASVTDPEGGVTLYDYFAADLLERITDARGVVKDENVYGYLHGDGVCNGHIDEVGDLDSGDGVLCSVKYAGRLDRRIVRQTRADGGVIRLDYRIANPLIPVSSVSQTVVTDPEGNQTTYRYNPQGYLLDITDANGQKVVYEREAGSNQVVAIRGNATCAVCENTSGGDVSFTRDINGNITSVTDALGNVSLAVYESVFNKLVSFTDALGNETISTYDANGNLASVSDANANTITYTYGDHGLLSAILDALGNISTFEYDGLGNLVQAVDSLGNTSRFHYDGNGRLRETVDANGSVQRIFYDDLNRVTQNIDARLGSSTFTYDEVGNLTTVIDGHGQLTSFGYDGVNNLVERIDAAGNSEYASYNLISNVVSHTDRKGATTLFSYDFLHRLVKESYADGAIVNRIYDVRGRTVEISDSHGGIESYEYNILGQLTEQSGPTASINYSYDTLGQIQSRRVLGQDAVFHEYDPVGNLTLTATPSASIDLLYDTLNRPVTLQRDNGVSTQYTYDALGRIVEILHQKDATILNHQSYSYDPVGNRISLDTDLVRPLATQASVRQYDDANRIINMGGTAFTYDENGNRTSKTDDTGTTTYDWDARDRLIRITSPSAVQTDFLYNSAGMLLTRQVTGSADDYREMYVVDRFANTLRRSRDTGLSQSVLTVPAIDSHLALFSEDEIEYIHTDPVNSTVLTTDGAGNTTRQIAYEPFGRASEEAQDFPFQFTGRELVADQLYYYRSRYFDPVVGSFISEDPTGFSGRDLNLYRYVNNNPVNFVDPGGNTSPLGVLSAALLLFTVEFEISIDVTAFVLEFFGNDRSLNKSHVIAGKRSPLAGDLINTGISIIFGQGAGPSQFFAKPETFDAIKKLKKRPKVIERLTDEQTGN